MIVFGVADQHRARRNQGDQLVLVDGEIVLAIVVAPEVFAEPVWKFGVDVSNGFAEASARERR